jgi:hypothetical protein
MVLLAVLILPGLALAGCERGFPAAPSGPTISEHEFVAGMVAILVEAPAHQDSRLPDAERDRILREMGLVPADLVTFAEVHGSDVSYMLSVWTRVDEAFLEAMNEAVVEPGGGDEAGPGSPEGPRSPEGPGFPEGPGR